jgi:hypothetical protein
VIEKSARKRRCGKNHLDFPRIVERNNIWLINLDPKPVNWKKDEEGI